MVSTLRPDYPLNSATLSTVFGDREIYDGGHDGYRMDFGLWLDGCHRWGLEADYFDLSGQPDSYDSGLSNGFNNGTPFPIVRGLYDPRNGLVLDGIALGASPGGSPLYVGRATVNTNDYFQSAGLWLRCQLLATEWSTCCDEVCWTAPSARTFRLDGIGGYRFARLMDTVDAEHDEVNVRTTDSNFMTQYHTANDYRTVNNFNGGELGLNAVGTFGRWSLDAVAKAALGLNNEFVSLTNLIVIDRTNQGGGIYSNAPLAVQEYSRDRFSFLPEFTLTGGYQVTDHLKVTAGYDLLYWTAVARAADQIPVERKSGYPYGSVAASQPRCPPLRGTSRTSWPRVCTWAPNCGSRERRVIPGGA